MKRAALNTHCASPSRASPIAFLVMNQAAPFAHTCLAPQNKLLALNFSEDDESSLYDSKKQLENQYSNLSETVDTMSAQLEGRLAFNYRDPSKNFDRKKVRGLVANLVNVGNAKNATALEVVAGGKLFQVVVDEASTGKALLANGKLQRRVTIIPLDKISSRPVSEGARSLASNIASKMGTSAVPAIELVGFDDDVRSAVEYVFGSSLVVDGMEAANKVSTRAHTHNTRALLNERSAGSPTQAGAPQRTPPPKC